MKRLSADVLWLSEWLSIRLASEPRSRKILDLIGGRCRFRTCDPRLVRPMLYR